MMTYSRFGDIQVKGDYKSLTLTAPTPSYFTFDEDTNTLSIRKAMSNITSSNVTIGQVIQFGKTKFRVRRIVKGSNQSYTLYMNHYSITNLFILPIFFTPFILNQCKGNFIGGYCFRENKFSKYISLVYYHDTSNVDYLDLSTVLTNEISSFLNSEKVGNFMIYNFEIDTKFSIDLDYIIKSKYSYISEGAKNRILKYFSYVGNFDVDSTDKIEDTIIYKVLYRKESLRISLENKLLVKIPKYLDLHEAFDPLKESLNMDMLDFDTNKKLTTDITVNTNYEFRADNTRIY